MIGKMLRGFWTHLQITFNDNYTIEGFEKTNKKFALPANLSELDPARKRELTICNLFANQNLSIYEIVKVLDSSLHQVIPALIEHDLIKERRRNRGSRGSSPPKAGRGGSLSILPEEKHIREDPDEPEVLSTAAKAFSCEELPVRETSPGSISFSSPGQRMAS